MGLAEGEVLKKSALQTVETELEQQYMQQGRYDADITVTTTPRPNNRVEVLIDFVEGKAAKVLISILSAILSLKNQILSRLSLLKVAGARSFHVMTVMHVKNGCEPGSFTCDVSEPWLHQLQYYQFKSEPE